MHTVAGCSTIVAVYVRRGKGILPPNQKMAAHYRANMAQEAVLFDAAIHRLLIDESLVASSFQHIRCHYLATAPTHLHALFSRTIDRKWQVVRAKLRESLTRRLNRELLRQEWFAKSPSRKRVRDRKHFDYLVEVYFPRHSELKWRDSRGIFQ
jgi:hypothetical protein